MAPTSRQAKAAGGKAPKAHVQRYLKSTEPKLVEGAKRSLLLKGIRCSQAMNTVLTDLRAMLSPHAKLLTKKNVIVAFEESGQHSLEFLATKNDCSIFCMASHNKKRPNNLIVGRTFDRQVLDMMELGIMRYKSIHDYGGSVPKKRVGSKPLLLFLGFQQHNSQHSKLQNMLIDLYRGDVVDKLVATGVDHIMVFTATGEEEMFHQRTYFVKLKKGNTRVPVPLLIPCGPDMDFMIRRTQFASPELYKASLKQPFKLKKSKRKKNQSTNLFGETIGRLHLESQNLQKMQGRKSKALRVAAKWDAEEEQAAIEHELQQEEAEMGREFQQTFGFEPDKQDK